jgi:agmatine deiminase
MTNLPKNLGYTMPAEWARHTATWLAWPYDPITFPQRVAKVEQVYCQLIDCLSAGEKVKILVRDKAAQTQVVKLLTDNGSNLNRVSFYQADYADVWIRDYGPTFLTHSDPKLKAWSKWRYNAYGNKFPELLKDDLVFNNLGGQVNGTKFAADLIMEGGAIEVNGQGLALTTEECLLNPNRNPNLSKGQIEELLKNYLGLTKVIWLKQGIHNDHTDGHIDELARFVNERTVLLAWTDDADNPNYQLVHENYEILQSETDLNGEKLTVVKLPLPQVSYDDGQLAPASYTNFYIANDLVLTVQFSQAEDRQANEIIGRYFPNRKIISLPADDLIYGGGTLHCITQQEP